MHNVNDQHDQAETYATRVSCKRYVIIRFRYHGTIRYHDLYESNTSECTDFKIDIVERYRIQFGTVVQYGTMAMVQCGDESNTNELKNAADMLDQLGTTLVKNRYELDTNWTVFIRWS